MKLINADKLNKSCDRREKVLFYFLSPITVFFIVLISFMCKGIYPFGIKTIDYYDMGQEGMAVYYHIYDCLHGTKNVFWDWYTALGMNMSNGISGSSNFNIFNLFLLFVKRDCILQSMSFFLMLKLMLMTVSFLYCAEKVFPEEDYLFKGMFSVGYGLCGYVFTHYTIFTWIDVAIMFPLVIASLMDVIRKGKIAGYVVTMSLSIMISYYISFMILLYIFFGYGLYTVLNKKYYKDSESSNTIMLGVGTLLALMIPAFAYVPQLMQMTSSSRFDNNEGLYKIFATVNSPYPARVWALLGVALPVSIIILSAFVKLRAKSELNKSKLIWISGLIFICCAELIFENINLIMHFGSYVHYPIRNGFIIYFTIAMCAISCLQNVFSYDDSKVKVRNILQLCGFCIGIVVTIAAFVLYRKNPTMELGSVIAITMALELILFGVYYLMLIGGKDRCKLFVPVILILQLCFYSNVLLGPIEFITHYAEEPEQESDYIGTSNQLVKGMDIKESAISRIKNPDTSLNANYGFVMKKATLTNETHLVTKRQQDGAALMGYSIQYTRLLDSGGTAFTDALLHVENVLSCILQDETLYKKVSDAEVVVKGSSEKKTMYSLYENKYRLPFVMTISNVEDVNKIENTEDIIAFHNEAYEALLRGTSCKEDIAKEQEADDFAQLIGIAQTGDNHVNINGNKLLYFVGTCTDCEYGNIELYVNGEPVLIPTIKDMDNTRYPAHFNNNTVYLGSFSDCELNVSMQLDDSVESEDFVKALFTLDVDKLEAVCQNVQSSAVCDENIAVDTNSMSFNVKGSDGQYALVPLSYDEGYKVMVNSKKSSAIDIKGMFTAIPLSEGDNNIEIVYHPKGLFMGIVVSFAGIIIFIAIMIVHAKKREFFDLVLENYFARTVINNMYIVAWAFAVMYVYLIPVMMYVLVKVGVLTGY